MATIKDVAQKSGFSICTVSRALSGKGYLKEETRAKIMAAIEELDYHTNTLASNLKSGRRHTLALILPSLTNLYYANLEKYMEAYATEKDYIIYLSNTEYNLEKEKRIINTIKGMDIAGVIIAPATSEHEHIKSLANSNIPYVYLNRTFKDDLEHCIRLDNYKGAYDAVKYMIKSGHTNIGGVFQSFDHSSGKEQFDGVLAALNDHNIPYIEDNFLFHVNPEDMNASKMLIQLLQKPDRPEAIFTSNDMMAFVLYRAAFVLGLHIPEQLSIFGFDDCTMANFLTPPLSTVSVPAKQFAKTSIDYIHHFLETGETKELPILKTSLVIRNSVSNLKMIKK